MEQLNDIKYVITKINDKPHILYVSKCNFCPFISLNREDFNCYCLKGKSNPRFISKTNSITYSENEVYTTSYIKKPNWCELDDFLTSINKPQYVYYIYNNKFCCDNIDVIDNLPIIFDDCVKFSKGKIVKNLKKTKNEKYDFIIQNNKNICSCCGINKDTVDRYKNMGLCDECHDKIKNKKDINMLNFIYLNNFRLKRKSTYSKSTFKKIMNKNFYNGLV